MYNEGEADEARQLELDSVKEAHCTALVQSAQYLQGIRRYHDRNMRERSFSIGDPTSHSGRIQPTQAQLKMGGSVHRQASYKTRVISTTMSRGPGCPELLEHSEPAQVLPMRR
jgi:hypothetical protein